MANNINERPLVQSMSTDDTFMVNVNAKLRRISLINAIALIKDKIMLSVYPVGAVYISIEETSPGKLFGGTWERINDTFLLSAGTKHKAGDTGGEENHTLTVEEMPSHTHEQNAHTHAQEQHRHVAAEHSHTFSGTTGENTHTHSLSGYGKTLGSGNTGWRFGRDGSETASGTVKNNTHSHGFSGTTSSNSSGWSGLGSGQINDATATNKNAGGGRSHNNMPPYLTVYMWKRVG